nr:response regulator [Acidobacteriota bacterium]
MLKRKLLLADDSVTIQKVVNLTFADEGIEVITVGDGEAAMQKFVEDKPVLVMADVNMPGPDGYRICEMIKQNDETRHIPVILLVGSFEPFDENEARRVGADDYLTKPFQSIRQLINKVSDLLAAQETTDFTEEGAVNSFHDTLEMEAFDKEPASTENLEDAATGDEIVITNQISSLPTDEAQKFESKPADESSAED